MYKYIQFNDWFKGFKSVQISVDVNFSRLERPSIFTCQSVTLRVKNQRNRKVLSNYDIQRIISVLNLYACKIPNVFSKKILKETWMTVKSLLLLDFCKTNTRLCIMLLHIPCNLLAGSLNNIQS